VFEQVVFVNTVDAEVRVTELAIERVIDNRERHDFVIFNQAANRLNSESPET
jgi:hypothetical protein